MILILTKKYPSPQSLYSYSFIHTRVKQYIEEGIQTKVFVLTKKNNANYVHDGVEVLSGGVKRLVKVVNELSDLQCVCCHFLDTLMLKAIHQFDKRIAILVFVHGNEALWWYQRIFPDRFSGLSMILSFIKYVTYNTYSLLSIRRSINKHNRSMHIICVSEWMMNITLKNWKIDQTKTSTQVIHNVIDEKKFKYTHKSPMLRYNILLIRPFISGKYALDIAMEIISELQKYPEAKLIKYTIIGDGPFFKKYTDRIKHIDNAVIIRKFLTQDEIVMYHSVNGIFLCPTRQDAQGVSMCEAMSSGLVPISSSNTAIPEFLPPKYNLAFDSVRSAVDRIIEIIREEKLFSVLSKEVSDFIHSKCSADKTTVKELELIKSIGSIYD